MQSFTDFTFLSLFGLKSVNLTVNDQWYLISAIVKDALKMKIFLFQLSLFSQYQFDFRLFIDGNFESFNHLFLHNWQSDYSDPVQRVPNPYAVFHIDDFYQSVNYAVTRFERHL